MLTFENGTTETSLLSLAFAETTLEAPLPGLATPFVISTKIKSLGILSSRV